MSTATHYENANFLRELAESLPRIFPGKDAAKAELQRVDRGAATLSLTLALGRPQLMPQSPVTVAGFKPEIDGEGWLVKSVEHSIGDGGYTTKLECERLGSGDAEGGEDAE